MKEVMKRGLSEKFMSALKDKDGVLTPFLHRVHSDPTLDLEIRNDYVNIYHRGGSLFRLGSGRVGYEVTFDEEYASGSKVLLNLPQNPIKSANDAEEWVACIPKIKDTMDLWFGKHPKDERALQQLVAWENNVSSWANGTDYFIIDLEYDNHKGARFDLVALKWESTAASRKLAKGCDTPRLVIIEMKAGDGAVNGKSGLIDHCDKITAFFNNSDQVKNFREEMVRIFKQKRELGLIRALKNNCNEIKSVDCKIDFMILLAGHDPSSRKLRAAISTIHEKKSYGNARPDIQICGANFMGYGLYKQSVYSLENFQTLFAEHLLESKKR